MIMLDTSAVIEVLRLTEKGDAILKEIAGKDVCLPVFAVYELLRGDGRKEWEIINRIPVVGFEKNHAARSSEVFRLLERRQEHIEAIDLFIASLAMENENELFTCDSDFKKIPGLQVHIF